MMCLNRASARFLLPGVVPRVITNNRVTLDSITVDSPFQIEANLLFLYQNKILASTI